WGRNIRPFPRSLGWRCRSRACRAREKIPRAVCWRSRACASSPSAAVITSAASTPSSSTWCCRGDEALSRSGARTREPTRGHHSCTGARARPAERTPLPCGLRQRSCPVGLRQRPRNWIRFAHQKGTHLRVTRIALGLTLTTLLATTAMAQKISTESAPGTNFGGYKTFMWVKQPTSPTRCSGSASSTTSTRSSRRRDSGVVTEGADLGVAAHMATRQEKSLNTFYDGFGGGWRWGGGFGTATTTVD